MTVPDSVPSDFRSSTPYDSVEAAGKKIYPLYFNKGTGLQMPSISFIMTVPDSVPSDFQSSTLLLLSVAEKYKYQLYSMSDQG
jgi:hypothetical protein